VASARGENCHVDGVCDHASAPDRVRPGCAPLRQPELGRYARVGRLLTGEALVDDAEAGDALVALLDQWTRLLGLPTLERFGITPEDHPRIVASSRGSSMKTNPIVLEDAEITAILEARQA